MYRIGTLRLAGEGWWEGRLEGPQDISIPIRQLRPGATEQELWTRLQDKCDALNVAQGMVTVCRTFGPTHEYRRRSRVIYK